MVYANIKENEVISIVVSCNCGCANIEIKTIDDAVFISVFGSNWYDYQGLSCFREYGERVYHKIVGKDNILCGLMMSVEDMNLFLDYAQRLKFGKDTNDTYVNHSHLDLDCISFDNNGVYDLFELFVVSDSKLKDILCNKSYRGYEICLKRSEWFKMIYEMSEKVKKNY